MKISELKSLIRETIERVLNENAPAPSKPKPSPGPAVAPGKPSEKPKEPRRPLGNPNVKPKPKAKMNEEEMLQKIVQRFKSKKMDELLSLSDKEKSDEKAKPAYTDAEIKAMSVDQAKAALKRGIWDVPHNSGIAAKLKKKIKDAEEAKKSK